LALLRKPHSHIGAANDSARPFALCYLLRLNIMLLIVSDKASLGDSLAEDLELRKNKL
jgi:hypothetical protein